MSTFEIGSGSVESDVMCIRRLADSELFCWGNKDALGEDASFAGPSKGVRIEFPKGVTAKQWAVGKSFVCAVTAPDDLLYCWGRNRDQRVSPFIDYQIEVPTRYVHRSWFKVQKVAVQPSRGVCIITKDLRDDEIWCWGGRYLGMRQQTYPTTLSRLIDIAAGDRHFCVLFSDGRIMCAGNNRWGQIDPSSSTEEKLLGYVDFWGADRKVSSMHLGAGHSCFHFEDKRVMCIGNILKYDPSVLLSFVNENRFDDFDNQTFRMVRSGGDHFCLMNLYNETRCYGTNTAGQLGLNSPLPRYVGVGDPAARPVNFSTDKQIVDMHLLEAGTCFYSDQNELMCIGDNENGLFGSKSNLFLDPNRVMLYLASGELLSSPVDLPSSSGVSEEQIVGIVYAVVFLLIGCYCCCCHPSNTI